MSLPRLICALTLALLAGAPIGAANPFSSPIEELELKDGTVLHHVVVVSFSSRVLMAKWDGGRGTIRVENLPDDLQPLARGFGSSADNDQLDHAVPAPNPRAVAAAPGPVPPPNGAPAAPRAEDAATVPSTAPAAGPKGALLGVGTAAPDFTVKDVSGRDVNLSDFRGKVVVLDFWATWCPPCQRSMPHTESVAREHKDDRVVVLAVCTSDTRAAYESWMPAHQPNFPDMMFTFDPGGKGNNRVSNALYGVEGIPAQFVIGADGLIKAVIVGFYADDVRLEAGLSKAGVPLDAATLAKVQQADRARAEKSALAAGDSKAKAAEWIKMPMHTQYGSLKAGDAVRPFTVTGADGRAISLSDFSGKTVVLGFWSAGNSTAVRATTEAMPHLSDLAERYKNQGVVVLNVCMLTPRPGFDAWVADNKDKYAFVTAYDPVGIPARDAAVKPLYMSLSKYPGYLRLPGALVISAQGKFVGYAIADNVAGAGLAMLLQRSGVRLAREDMPKAPAPAAVTAN